MKMLKENRENRENRENNELLRKNPLQTRDDVRQCLMDLLSPLQEHKVPGGYYLGDASAHYSPGTALMEGFCRTLWGIAPLLAGSATGAAAGGRAYPTLDQVVSLLSQGVNPAAPEYWGVPLDKDQMLVEMASIALSLMIARNDFWEPLTVSQKEQLYCWLSTIEKRELPPTNWHFFRIMVCTAFRELGLPVDEKAENESFDLIESCYRGDGWYQDGLDGGYDFYNPWAFHFYGLVYAKIARHRDPKRAAQYIERAKLFAPGFALWFSDEGAVIPYGRSLCYRFAALSFFSACAFADVEALPWAHMKGIVLQHLRYWMKRPILDKGGVLSVGYGYPNLVMADTYNSPGSPYWGLKAFLVLALGEDHPFWKTCEAPEYVAGKSTAVTTGGERGSINTAPEAHGEKKEKVVSEKIPGFIITKTTEDTQLLTAGNYPYFDMNHAAQKYCKFAYSARFGFCVAHSNYDIEKTGCDSMLMLSEKAAENGAPSEEKGGKYWRERRETTEHSTGTNWVRSVWYPWPDVKITTTLISLGLWHMRIHRIESGRNLIAVEGGFALPRYHQFDKVIPATNTASLPEEALINLPWGASRIVALDTASAEAENAGGAGSVSKRTGSIVIPAPNLNVLSPSVLIPVITGGVHPGTTEWITAVRAGDREAVIHEAVPPLTYPSR
jgi:hypothetical protein